MERTSKSTSNARSKSVSAKTKASSEKAKDLKNQDVKKQSAKESSSSKKAIAKSKAKAGEQKVKAKIDAATDLKDLYEDGLKDLYWAEKALAKALPKMEKNATSPKLKAGIKKHLGETEKHIERLEKCFKELGVKAKAEKCDAMDGLLEEAKGIMEACEIGVVRDAGIIAAVQKVEHYEIASYGTLAAFAKVLKQKDSLKLLLKTLEEEKKCDEDLTKIADTNLNSKADK